MSELTFAEAVALDPGAVEVRFVENDKWEPLSMWDGRDVSLAEWRTARFRRARPRRTRVQEMAQDKYPSAADEHNTILTVDLEARTEMTRAVCEYLRTAPVLNKGLCDGVARVIERHFL